MASRPKPVLTSAHRVVLRLAIDDRPGMFAEVARVIGEQGGSLGVIDLVEATPRVHDILPSPFDPQVVLHVARAVAECARASGMTR